MRTVAIDGLNLYFDSEEQDTADLVASACAKSMVIVRESWGLEPPKDCRVYVMTSWLGFLLRSTPWPWRILAAASTPLWIFRVRTLWEQAGGWAQSYGQRQVVGVKPPRLIATSAKSIGAHIFVQEADPRLKVEQITCHELTHAFAAHLRLPMWLNEGMAMVTVDRYCGRQTVRIDTLDALIEPVEATAPESSRKVRIEDQKGLVYHCVRGYWLTRFIEDTAPGLLSSGLAQGLAAREVEDKVAAACGLETHAFWSEIDGLIVSHFRKPGFP